MSWTSISTSPAISTRLIPHHFVTINHHSPLLTITNHHRKSQKCWCLALYLWLRVLTNHRSRWKPGLHFGSCFRFCLGFGLGFWHRLTLWRSDGGSSRLTYHYSIMIYSDHYTHGKKSNHTSQIFSYKVSLLKLIQDPNPTLAEPPNVPPQILEAAI